MSRMDTSNHVPLTLSDLNDDVLLDICDHLVIYSRRDDGRIVRDRTKTPLKNLSLTNRRLRALLRPKLLSSIALTEQRNRLVNGWVIARKAIEGLASTESLIIVKKLELNLYGYVWDNEYALAEDVDYITGFLRRLPNLQFLRLGVPHPYMLGFETALKSNAGTSPLAFHNVTTLCIEWRMIFLLECCPNLKRLALCNSNEEHIRLYQLKIAHDIPCARKVIHFEARSLWTTPEVTYLASTFPCIQHLAVVGYEGFPSLRMFTSILGEYFKQLRILALPDVANWVVGARQKIPASFRADGDFWRKYYEKRNWAEDAAAELAFGACKKLEECWLGEDAIARIVKRDNVENNEGSGGTPHGYIVGEDHQSTTKARNDIRWEWTRDGLVEMEARLLTTDKR
jgi:hypothetical protein